jgi:hypothetical protein
MHFDAHSFFYFIISLEISLVLRANGIPRTVITATNRNS